MLKINGIDSWTMQKGKSIKPSAVRVIQDSPNRVVAGVRGTEDYRVEIVREDVSITGNCSCPAFFGSSVCKHIAALWMNLPPKFLSVSHPQTTYFFEMENDSFFEEDLEEDDYHQTEFYGAQIVERQEINTVLDYLENTMSRKTNRDPLEIFYEKNYLDIVYQFGFNDFSENLVLHVKCRQLLKNGTFGKIKTFNFEDWALERIPDDARKYLIYDPYSKSSYLSIPVLKIKTVMPLLIKTNSVYNVDEEKIEWLDSTLQTRIETDSINKKFQIRYQFTDAIIRNEILIFFERGYGLHKTNFFLCERAIPSELINTLETFENQELEPSQWESLKKILVQNFPALIGGDKFNLETKDVSLKICFHFRYYSRESIEVIALKEKQIIDNAIPVEDSILKDDIEKVTGTRLGESFIVNYEKLLSLMTYFNEKGIEFHSNRKKVVTFNDYALKVQSNIDWFETGLEIKDNHIGLDAAEILKAIRNNSQFVTLKTGEEVLLPEELRKKLSHLSKFSSLKDNKFITHKTRSLILENWDMNKFSSDTQFLSFKNKLKEFERILPQRAHRSFKATLRDYQALGLGWMEFLQDMEMGGCLADDMGLGKTVQVLSLLHKRKKSSQSRPTLIVCPKSLIFNWQQEAEKFAPDLKVEVFPGGQWKEDFLDCDLLLMSYAMVPRNIEDLKDITFDYIILDEAQAIKNPSSLTAKACYMLQSHHRLALTGTPIENHAGDLMSIFNFLIPGCFSLGMMKDKMTRTDDLGFLKPFILRRKKEDVLKELPAKTDQVIYCEQSIEEKKYYQKLKNVIRDEVRNEENKIQVLTALMRLRQASSHIGLVDKKFKNQESGKLIVLKEMVSEIIESGHKVLIFSQFTELLKITRDYLEMDDSNSVYLDGSSRNRQNLVNDFKTNGDKKCFFISLKAGGTGLNLTEANYCFILDPWWNPAVENQAIDRIHRIGQTQPVNAYRLISKETVEEKVLELQTKKAELAKNFMESNEDFIRKLGAEELNFLFN